MRGILLLEILLVLPLANAPRKRWVPLASYRAATIGTCATIFCPT
jgi:hypothetical protein